MPRWTEHQRAIIPELPLDGTYYVYGLYDSAGLFYVGKGRRHRCVQHFSDYHLKQNTPKNSRIKKTNSRGERVRISLFAIHLSETEALDLERKLILSFGLKSEGGILTNLRYGSLDSTGLWTEDRKKLHSKRLRGKNSQVPEELVKKAKCLSYYCGYTAKQIVDLDDFAHFNLAPSTVKAWCRGDKFSYILPHLNHTQADLAREKREDCLRLYFKGHDAKEISDILGLSHVHHYIKDYKDLSDVALLNDVINLVYWGYSYNQISDRLGIGPFQVGRMWRGECGWQDKQDVLSELRSVGAFL